MRRWGYLVAGLYALILLGLTPPLYYLQGKVEAEDGWRFLLAWQYWLLGILPLVAGQLLLLLVPVRAAEGRLRSRRPLLVPVITAAFFLAVLVFMAVGSVCCAAWGDGVLVFADRWWPLPVSAVLVLWTAWGLLFYRFSREADPEALTRRLVAWLLRGSILELLVAVPSHIVTRSKDDCCAPGATLVGIATGISVMLMSFGPGVFWLFAARCAKLRPKGALAEPARGPSE